MQDAHPGVLGGTKVTCRKAVVRFA